MVITHENSTIFGMVRIRIRRTNVKYSHKPHIKINYLKLTTKAS